MTKNTKFRTVLALALTAFAATSLVEIRGAHSEPRVAAKAGVNIIAEKKGGIIAERKTQIIAEKKMLNVGSNVLRNINRLEIEDIVDNARLRSNFKGRRLIDE